MSHTSQAPIGLVAGWGRFPILIAEKAKQLGLAVHCVGLRHEASPELTSLVEEFHWSGVLQLGKIIRTLKHAGVKKVTWAGKIHKASLLYRPWRIFSVIPDWRAFRAYLRSRKNWRDDTILLELVHEFEKDGMTIVPATEICPELLVQPGALTRRKLTTTEKADVEQGWVLAKVMGEHDVGQSVMLKDGCILAVEAVEGTDRAILRAGELCRSGGFTVVKVAKPQQDMRFDVPTIGQQTIETMHQAKATVLAIEAHKTIILDQEATVALAERYGISIVAR